MEKMTGRRDSRHEGNKMMRTFQGEWAILRQYSKGSTHGNSRNSRNMSWFISGIFVRGSDWEYHEPDPNFFNPMAVLGSFIRKHYGYGRKTDDWMATKHTTSAGRHLNPWTHLNIRRWSRPPNDTQHNPCQALLTARFSGLFFQMLHLACVSGCTHGRIYFI